MPQHRLSFKGEALVGRAAVFKGEAPVANAPAPAAAQNTILNLQVEQVQESSLAHLDLQVADSDDAHSDTLHYDPSSDAPLNPSHSEALYPRHANLPNSDAAETSKGPIPLPRPVVGGSTTTAGSTTTTTLLVTNTSNTHMSKKIPLQILIDMETELLGEGERGEREGRKTPFQCPTWLLVSQSAFMNHDS